MGIDNRPIIVGGCHRSGTSMVRRILNAHSRIYCGPEVKFFRDFHNDYFFDPLAYDRFIATARAMLPDEELFALLGPTFVTLHERAAARAGKPRWADKTPENIIYLAEWERLLGDRWLFLHIVRNPLDTLASIEEARFNNTIPSGLDARIDFYRRYNQAGFDFRTRHPERYRQVVYEELVTRPEEVLSGIMGWLGEEFETRQLKFNDQPQERGTEDPKVHETTGIHRESVGRWKAALKPEEARRIFDQLSAFWQQIDPTCIWMDTPRTEQAVSTRTAEGSTEGGTATRALDFGELAQVSSALAQEKFEMQKEREAAEAWSRQLLEEIAARDRELDRIKNFWPIRAALTIRDRLGLGPAAQ